MQELRVNFNSFVCFLLGLWYDTAWRETDRLLHFIHIRCKSTPNSVLILESFVILPHHFINFKVFHNFSNIQLNSFLKLYIKGYAVCW